VDFEYNFQKLKQVTETSPSGLARVSITDKTYQDKDAKGKPFGTLLTNPTKYSFVLIFEILQF